MMARNEMIAYLMDHAEFRHVPVCDYDETEECAFSRDECEAELHKLKNDELEKMCESGGCEFVSEQYYYDHDIDRFAKYNDLRVYDANGILVKTLCSDYDNETAQEMGIWEE